MLQPTLCTAFLLDGSSQQISTKLEFPLTHSREWQILLWGENVEVKMMGPCCAKICITDGRNIPDYRATHPFVRARVGRGIVAVARGYIFGPSILEALLLSVAVIRKLLRGNLGGRSGMSTFYTKHPAQPPARGRRKEF